MSKRVYELAKELGMSNKAVIDKLKNMGINASSHMNVLSDEDCERVRNNLKSQQPKSTQSDGQAGSDKTVNVKAAKDGETIKSAKSEKGAGGQAKQHVKRKPEIQEASSDQQSRSDKKPQDKKKKAPVGDRVKSGRPNERSAGGQSSGSRQQGGKPGTGGRDKVKKDNRQDKNRPNDNSKNSSHKNDSRGDNKNAGDKKNNKRGNIGNLSKPQHSHKKDTRKEQRKEAARKAEEEAMAIPAGAIVITVPITVKGLSEQIDVSASQIIMTLMKMGIMANMNQNLDEDTVLILGEEFKKTIIVGKIEQEEVEEGIEHFDDREEDLKQRPPIITVMGHVDHGKTSLLDRIRKTSVTESESGGITQHIGASEVTHNGQRIVFLDTPGHEAFTAMRARGAYVTDIAVLVVAADDSVKPQTIEAISHAKAANVPIIVAINKIDKPGANVDKVKQDLSEHNILVEDWGGDVISVPVSAKTGEGLDSLMEMILLQAEILELKANPSRLALGTVIEARLDKQRGPVATLLVLNGTLHAGMSIVAGNCSGRIKAMTNFKGDVMKKAGPATAVEILGLTDVPEAGDEFNAVRSDKIARDIAEKRKIRQREQVMQKTSGVTLDDLFSHIEQGELRELNLIIKADVQGSVGALVTSLEKLKNEEVAVKIIHTGVGAVNESDVMLASTTGAIIIGFNVRPSAAVTSMAQRDGVEIRTYRVIYEAIEEVEAALKGMLAPEYKEQVLGTIEVRNTFKVPNVGIVAGAYVLDGKVERNAQVRLVRDGIVIHEGKISSLRRFKDDVKEVSHGFECGIGIENYNDIKEGDIIEAFKMVEVERK
ncbi:MAG: translation initiation factor IF-2 [Firmicutes bacterium]|nr:translation initiation factor IF-2 [Bacillota bacterium]